MRPDTYRIGGTPEVQPLEQPEDDVQRERRLEREARTNFLGVLGVDAKHATDTARVEVTRQRPGEREQAGYYLVHVKVPREAEPTLDNHPATLASDIVHAHVEGVNYEYFSIDDTYAA